MEGLGGGREGGRGELLRGMKMRNLRMAGEWGDVCVVLGLTLILNEGLVGVIGRDMEIDLLTK